MAGLDCSKTSDLLVLKGRSCSLVMDRPYIVGILNVTPDSFSDGGRYTSLEKAVVRSREMIAEGADWIDIGGESTRPGASPVSSQQEMDRVVPVIEALKAESGLPLSVDTSKSSVAGEAISAGAEFVNDISGLAFDEKMAEVVATYDAGLIIMHTRGRPDLMQKDTRYDDVVAEVKSSLRISLDRARSAGIGLSKIAIDPGIGFGKDVSGNLELLKRLDELSELGCAVMLGTSRKSFIGKVTGIETPAERVAGTLASVALGYAGGARLFRVHDVAAARQAALVARAICRGAEWSAF